VLGKSRSCGESFFNWKESAQLTIPGRKPQGEGGGKEGRECVVGLKLCLKGRQTWYRYQTITPEGNSKNPSEKTRMTGGSMSSGCVGASVSKRICKVRKNFRPGSEIYGQPEGQWEKWTNKIGRDQSFDGRKDLI